MATFGEFLRIERKNIGLNQSEFGYKLNIIMTDVSKIENGRKKFPFEKLKQLANFLNKDYTEIKNLYVAERLVQVVHKYKCQDTVFAIAANQSKYIKSKQAKQGTLKF